jgi:hypothetical protein
MTYKPGDVANGHVLTTENTWVPLAVVAPVSQTVIVNAGTNHAFHLLMSVLTFGLWLPVWLLAAIFGGRARRV